MTDKTSSCNPELWGGIECTVNRVGDQYFDQLRFSGHEARESDIEAIAALGIRKIRYPILWERHQPERDSSIDWSWAARRLHLLKRAGIEPIAGLVHHGSGPRFTDLLDPQFGEKLARYAALVVRRFPELTFFTPVNEPLTTARFSGLYGLWYPHGNSDQAFITALLHQVQATILSMQAIREINPGAKLIQTEDLGKTYSTPRLKYQADFENRRRWLSYDLLCGKVDKGHALYPYLIKHGADAALLQWMTEHPCPPDIFGFNYYVTSERYLDERTHLFPAGTAGGNGRHTYCDVEAIRVPLDVPTGPEVLLREAYERYGGAIALTEVHLHCHREDQVRWFECMWESVKRLRSEGVPVKAVTAWSLLGAHGWDKLLTEGKGNYEPGVFDIRSGSARPTALARRLQELKEEKGMPHPSLCGQGWWSREDRFFPALQQKDLSGQLDIAPPILIIGKRGTLGAALARVCRERHLTHVVLDRQGCDLADPASISIALDTYRPWAVINAAGYVRVDEAETNAGACLRDNAFGPKYLALACARRNISLCTFSSDLVFDGAKETPYQEGDPTNPLNGYGRSKALAEGWVLEAHPKALVVRTSAFFGPWDPYNFAHHVRTTLSEGRVFEAAEDEWVSPTYVPDLAHAVLDLMVDGESGIWHLANEGAVTWAGFAREIAQHFNLPQELVAGVHGASFKRPAARPGYTVLGSSRGQLLPSLTDALKRYAALVETAGLAEGIGQGISHAAV